MNSRVFRMGISVVFMALLIVIMWRINNYPNSFDACVENAIHYQVEEVLDNKDISGVVTWKWTDMHQHGAGRSPIYSYIIESGIRLFGLSLFGVRFIEAFIGFLSLILLYFTMIKYYSKRFTTSFIILLATSPWFLIMNRSGGIIGFSLTLLINCISLITLTYYYKNKINNSLNYDFDWKERLYIFIPILAGISIGLLPYGHAIIRIITVFIILWVLINGKRFGKVACFTILISMLLIFSIQLQDIDNARKMFFNARGENLISVAKGHKGQEMQFIESKIRENINYTIKILLGQNDKNNYWNPNIADSYWREDIVLYPKFLVPFFALGMIIYIFKFFKEFKSKYFLPIALFGLTLLPGIMSGMGTPNEARNYLMILPLYFFITIGMEGTLNVIKKMKYLNSRYIVVFLACTVITIASLYQIINFFGQIKGAYDELDTPYHDVYKYLNIYFKQNPNAKVLIHGFSPFNEYGYVLLRWLGGEEYQNRLENGTIKYVQNDNKEQIRKLIDDGYFDLIITTANDVLTITYPEFKGDAYRQSGRIYIYEINNINNAIQV